MNFKNRSYGNLPKMNKYGFFRWFWVFWVLGVIFNFALIGGLIYVTVHFIQKYW